MPEVDHADIEEMTADEQQRAVEAAVDATGDNEEVMGFAPRDS